MKVLAIESSCDETSAAVVCDAATPDGRILSNVIKSQIAIHAEFGGVVPEIAARNHMDVIDVVVEEALEKANETLKTVDLIAATAGPGLIGGLLVGMVTAKALALMNGKPFMAINHLEGHLLTPRLCYDVEFPYLLLLASGGHFLFAEIFGVGKYEVLGKTLDDAAGEAFDKVARMLGLAYPGGPSIQKIAKNGDSSRFDYTIPMQRRIGCDVSFSGIKTATKLHIATLKNICDQDRADVAASFQLTVITHITKKLRKAYQMTKSKPKNIVIAGGVAANEALREAVAKICEQENFNFSAPSLELCSDNAAMIGWAAIERMLAGFKPSKLDAKTRPRWPITEIDDSTESNIE
ncbi:MAG: tRNA (adenosine(37)-N6)-threonylcarbamoyltransferase complex transferase subunit TsaD [Holosporales bacterium]|nr:tRNA (adenosine(37)-N6)-threonylcarbamoyltransferase complex transferase subunit TsaD [Holosporales bacterium]